MPTDPNARGNSILENILKAMNKQNDLLATQNKILEKMEKHARPSVVSQQHLYLKATEPQLPGAVPPSRELHEGPYGTGPSQSDR